MEPEYPPLPEKKPQNLMSDGDEESQSRSRSQRSGISSSPSLSKDSSTYFDGKQEWEGGEVRVRCTVTRLINISLQDQEFEAQLCLEASWLLHGEAEVPPELQERKTTRPPRGPKFYPEPLFEPMGCKEDDVLPELQVDKENSSMDGGSFKVIGIEKTFDAPRLVFRNCIETKSSEDWWKIHEDNTDVPIVCYRWKVQARFQEPFELQHFPIDMQPLSIALIAYWGSATEYVRLVENFNPKYRSCVSEYAFTGKAQYKLYPNLRFRQLIVHRKESFSSAAYMGLEISMRVDRLPGFWLWNVAVPLFFLTSCSFGSWAIPADKLGERSTITLTVLLTQIASKLVIADRMPNINYLTLLDKFVLGCLLVEFTLLFESFLAALGYGFSIGSDETRLRLMLYGFFTFFIVFLILLGGAMIKVGKEKSRNAEWYSKDDWLWIGPLPDVTDDEIPDIKKALKKFVISQLDTASDKAVKDIKVWKSENAEKHLRENKIIIESANSARKDQRSSQLQKQQTSRCNGGGFAIVHFRTEEEAKKVVVVVDFGIREARKKCEGDCKDGYVKIGYKDIQVKVEKLTRSLYSLTTAQNPEPTR